jgi:hypothetical protein
MALLGIATLPLAWLLAPSAIGEAYDIDGAAIAGPFLILLVSSWIMSGVLGWYRFLVLLEKDKKRSLLLAAGMALWVLTSGALVANDGALAMAGAVGIGQVAMAAAIIAWFVKCTGARSE